MPTGSALAAIRDHWDALSAGWLAWRDVFERGGAPVTARLVALAGVRPGQHVLDVGTGLGEPALTVASAVGPHGRVVGIDISGEMIKIARRRASRVSNVEFIEAAPETWHTDERFDVVLCRWSLMFCPDRVATLRALRALLVPGGVLAAAVWGPPPSAPVVSLAFRVLADRLSLPPPRPDEPGPYAMADRGRCRSELAAAGFDGVRLVDVDAPFWVADGHEYSRFAQDILPERFRRMLRERYGRPDDPPTWTEVARLAQARAGADGRVNLTARVPCLRGHAPVAAGASAGWR